MYKVSCLTCNYIHPDSFIAHGQAKATFLYRYHSELDHAVVIKFEEESSMQPKYKIIECVNTPDGFDFDVWLGNTLIGRFETRRKAENWIKKQLTKEDAQ